MDYRFHVIVVNLSDGDRLSDVQRQEALLRALPRASTVESPGDNDERVEIHFNVEAEGKDQALGKARNAYTVAMERSGMAGPSTLEVVELDGENVTAEFLMPLNDS
jgi:hypothetical protein